MKTNSKNNITIRDAKRSDLIKVHELVKQLAEFEKEPDAVITTIEDYEYAYDHKDIGVIVAEYDDTVVGMALFYLAFSTWKGRMLYLEDFFVEPKYRQLGIGQLLFDAFIVEAKKQHCTMVKWQVLDWNEPALRFYKKNGSVIEKEWWNGKIIFHN